MIHYSETSPLAEYLHLNQLLSPQETFSNQTNSPPPEQEQGETPLTYGQFVQKVFGNHPSNKILRLMHVGFGDVLQLAYVKYTHTIPYNPINSICNWQLPLYFVLNLLPVLAFCWGYYWMLLLCVLLFARIPQSSNLTQTIHQTLQSIHSQLKLKCFHLETQIVAAKGQKHTEQYRSIEADVYCLVAKINDLYNIGYPTPMFTDILQLWRYFQSELLERHRAYLKDGISFNVFKWKYRWIRGQQQIAKAEKLFRLFNKFEQIQQRNNLISSLQQTAQQIRRKYVDHSCVYYALLLKNVSANSKTAASALLKCYQIRQLFAFYSQKVHVPHPIQLEQPLQQIVQQVVQQELPSKEYLPELLSEYQADFQGLKFKLQAILDVPDTNSELGLNKSAQENDYSWKYCNQPTVSFGLGILPPPRDMSEFVYE